ncbi:3-hydroxyacyl-CoA dehydrogenase family protein, partial [Rhodoplanes sp. SY1]|uniref:3-hydroxyacyl-CoA dehydrogenase family protein n=1 Tax=Rhodoplanes sp. SY1 TaxID=3166646 RepID=UPI0038B423AF
TCLAWGKTPVHCRSTPGFIVNRVARPFYGEALRLIAEGAASPATIDASIKRAPDPLVERIVAGWPHRFDAARARALGFVAETTFDEIVRIHIEDDLGGRIPD